jgi:hypothetical protein
MPARTPPREAQEQEDGDERHRAGVAVGDGPGGREYEEDDERDGEDGRERQRREPSRRASRLAADRQVGEERREVAGRAGGVAAVEALLELVGVQAPVEVVAAERLGDALAVGVGRAEAGRGIGEA